MNHKRLWIAAAIIAVAIFIGFVLSVPHTRDVGDSKFSQNAAPSVPSVSLRDSFKKGVHTITGSVEAPNACASASAKASLAGEGSESAILVALTLKDDGGVCLQVPTRVTFSVTISAPVDLAIIATVNGESATTTAP
ncbi:MAG: hypothetical protein WCT41_01070 [Candidatus Paceibacterota bacterium]|jgi:hypothetical protein